MKQVSADREALLRLEEHSHRVAHDHAEFSDHSDLVWHALLANSDTVTRFCKGSRNRVNLGRPATRRHDTGILLCVGKPALQGWLSDGLLLTYARTPEWDTRTGGGDDPGAYTDVQIDSPTHRDGQGWVIIPTEDLALDTVERDGDVPKWCTEERIAAPWTRLLRRALDPEDSTVIEHGTTLGTLAAIRMIRNSGIGHVDYSPPLGRDGRVSLPDIYDDVATISIYVPEERLAFSTETVWRLGEQKGPYNPHNEFFDMPDVDPPSNGFLEAN